MPKIKVPLTDAILYNYKKEIAEKNLCDLRVGKIYKQNFYSLENAGHYAIKGEVYKDDHYCKDGSPPKMSHSKTSH